MRIGLLFAAIVCMPLLAAAQDPITIDSKHYKILLENDQVRVLKIVYGPHEKSVMHEHPDSVAVYLTDVNSKFTMPDGSSRPSTWKAGSVSFGPAGKHLPENVGAAPFELVLVELKGRPASYEPVSLDPVKVDPTRHEVIMENDRVRVLRVKYPARDKSLEHEHPNSVAVFMTPQMVKVTPVGGKVRTGGAEAGSVSWVPRERHVVENTGDKPVEVILVELR